MLTLPKHNRYDYSVIDQRKDYSWPGGKRLAFCLTTNIEVYAYRRGTGWDPAKKNEPQQQRNYAWRDYGNRVGIWRMFDLFDQLKLPAAHNINSLLYEYHPQITDRIRQRGDEIRRTWPHECRAPGPNVGGRRSAPDRRVHAGDRAARGKEAEGWLGPAIWPRADVTLDLLKEAGYSYVMDWPADDQPFWMRDPLGADPFGAVPGRDQRFTGAGHPPARPRREFRRHDHRSSSTNS